jgi:hypothetical protein
MIQLNPDCLIFQTSNGESIPCSAELVTIELIGPAADILDPDLIRDASAAVLHYFKVELGRTFVTVAEFSDALERVLRGLGLTVRPAEESCAGQVKAADLRQIACDSGKGCELFFFPHLRDEMRRLLNQSPEVLQFTGLRSCVKQLVGARRWSYRCQVLSDQIVEYLRGCLCHDSRKACALVVL